MKIELSTAGAKLVDSDDFAHFLVTAPTAFDDAQIAAALHASGAGYLADDAAMISATWIKATVPLTAVWLEGFGAMLSFAESRGWLGAFMSYGTLICHPVGSIGTVELLGCASAPAVVAIP
jgi:hypothetical protein